MTCSGVTASSASIQPSIFHAQPDRQADPVLPRTPLHVVERVDFRCADLAAHAVELFRVHAVLHKFGNRRVERASASQRNALNRRNPKLNMP